MYKLHYLKTRGRAEQIRLLFHELAVDFETVTVGGDSLAQLKAEGPGSLAFGSVPMLEEDQFKLVQAPVILSYLARKHGMAPLDSQAAAKADAITWGAEDLRIAYFKLFGADADAKQAAFVDGAWSKRWLPAFDGLLELNGDNGFFVGGHLTHADVAVWDVLDSMLEWVKGATLSGHPRVQTFFHDIKARPRITAYLDSDARPKG